MKVIVKARHMNLTPALKAHAEKKLGESLMRIFDRPAVRLEIELGEDGKAKDGANHECRVSLSMPKGATINIHEVADDMYKAIDLAHDRLLQQVKRARGKRTNNSRDRKSAAKNRSDAARDSLGSGMEAWEKEVMEFESTPAS